MADVDNSFGSLTVYFDNAIIQSGSAKIKVDNSFGENKSLHSERMENREQPWSGIRKRQNTWCMRGKQ